MIRIIPFELEHLRDLPIDGRVSPWYFDAIAAATSVTVITDRVIAAGGIIPTATGSGMMWSALTPATGPHMLAITRAATRLMDASLLRRIEATVEVGFDKGCRWLDLLGFTLETPNGMKAFGIDGKSHYLYGWAR